MSDEKSHPTFSWSADEMGVQHSGVPNYDDNEENP